GVGPGPNPITTAKVKSLSAEVAGGFQTGTNVISLRGPTAQVRFEAGVGDIVGAIGAGADFDVVHQAFADVEQADLAVHDAGLIIGPQVQCAGGLDIGPGRFAGLVAVGPIGGEAMIGTRIDQFQTA